MLLEVNGKSTYIVLNATRHQGVGCIHIDWLVNDAEGFSSRSGDYDSYTTICWATMVRCLP